MNSLCFGIAATSGLIDVKKSVENFINFLTFG